MTDLALPQPRPLGASTGMWRAAEERIFSPRYLLVRRCGFGIALVLVAFHYSLSTLVRTLKDETPLAYLGLVPIIALLLAAAQIRPETREPSIHDRQVDYIIGLPLLVGPLVFDILMPIRLSTLFWLDRLDLVVLPVFVAGTITLLFGVRTLWRLRVPVLFLLLAWPLPYSTLLVNWLTAFTNSTLDGLNVMLHVARVAVAAPSQGVGVYTVKHGKTPFPVSVASACSGVNGIVGYLLVAVAFLAVVVGSWFRKLLWLGFGLGAVWVSNVLRIFAILVAGNRWGETVAIDVLHPVMGLVTFNLVVLGMVLVMGLFGLRLRFSGSSGKAGLGDQMRKAVPSIRGAAVILVALAGLGYFANSTLRQFDLVVTDLGAPRLTSFSDSPSHPLDWNVVRTDTYTWAKPFFGDDSTWYRYQFSWNGNVAAPLKSNEAVISDVINTSDLNSFSTYGIEACYQFHGYKLYSIRTVDLGGGVTGNVLAYYNTGTKSDWTTLYWHWPVKTPDGKTRYERVTLMLINTNDAYFTAPPASSSVLRSLGLGVENALVGKSSSVDSRFDKTRTFLIEFAHEVIANKAAVSSGKSPASGAGSSTRAVASGAGDSLRS